MFLTLIRRLTRDRNANFGVTTAILTVPLVFIAGGVVDISVAYQLNNRLQAAADAAMLGSINATSDGIAHYANGGSPRAEAEAEAEAKSLFRSEMGSDFDRYQMSFDVDAHFAGGQIRIDGHYGAVAPVSFVRLLGFQDFVVRGTAKAVVDLASFTDIHLVLDNSPSMGVGATTDDIRLMEANTEAHCAFACHNGDAGDHSNYHVAKAVGARMRIDLVRMATEAIIGSMRENNLGSDSYRLSLYTFGASAQKLGLTQLVEPTSNTDVLEDAAAKIDLMTTPSLDYNFGALTPHDAVLDKLSQRMSASGKGNGPSDRKKVVVLVTDGVTSNVPLNNQCPQRRYLGYRCVSPLDTTYCTALKKKNIRVAVLYTTYLPLPENGFYRDWVRSFSAKIGPALSSCASPGLFFEVNFDGGVDRAMKALFNRILASPRLTG